MFDDLGSNLNSWYYANTPTWLGGNRGLPQEGPTMSGATLDQMPAGQSQPGSSSDLGQALQALAKSPLAKQPDASPLPAAPIPKGTPGSPGRPLGLDALVKLLQQRQAQYGTLSGQPVAQPRALGLLGF
jgi:hypothetical protein